MGDNFYIALNINYGPGFRSTALRGFYKLVSMSEELSALRQRVEQLEELLEAAAGGEEALSDRIHNHELWLKEISIDNGEARISKLEGELQGYDLHAIVQGIEKLEKQLAALMENFAEELEVIRYEMRQSHEQLAEEISELSSCLEAVEGRIDDQAEVITELGGKIEQEAANREKAILSSITWLREVRQAVSAQTSQVQSLQQQIESQESEIRSLRHQQSHADGQIAYLQSAVTRPVFSDQLLGCLLGVAFLAGFGWLVLKFFQWFFGMFR